MQGKPPFPFPPLPPGLVEALGALQPPPWLVAELQQRLVLLINHVLQQEPEAMQRLARHRGKAIQMRWSRFDLLVRATAAGLLDLAADAPTPDLRIEVAEPSHLELARTLLAGQRPPVHIEGDVQLAAEVGWLAEHLRWDMEDDLSRLLGDVPAHALGEAARRARSALAAFAARRPPGAGAGSGPAAGTGGTAAP